MRDTLTAPKQRAMLSVAHKIFVTLIVGALILLAYLWETLPVDPTLGYAPTSWCDEHHPDWTLEQCADAVGF